MATNEVFGYPGSSAGEKTEVIKHTQQIMQMRPSLVTDILSIAIVEIDLAAVVTRLALEISRVLRTE